MRRSSRLATSAPSVSRVDNRVGVDRPIGTIVVVPAVTFVVSIVFLLSWGALMRNSTAPIGLLWSYPLMCCAVGALLPSVSSYRLRRVLCGWVGTSLALLVYTQGFGPCVATMWMVCGGCVALGDAMANTLTGMQRTRANGRRCRECGYDLTGNVTGVCPECGSIVGP